MTKTAPPAGGFPWCLIGQIVLIIINIIEEVTKDDDKK